MEYINTQIAIIGSGACGLACGLTTAAAGKKTIIFEKMPSCGGMTQCAEGMFAIGSKYQKQMKVYLDVESHFLAHMEESRWLANPRLVKRFMDRTADTIDWLEEQGCLFTGVTTFGPGKPFVWHMLQGSEKGAHGSGSPAAYGLVRPLLERVNENENIELRLATAVTDLLRDEEGRICGLLARDSDGVEYHVQAQAVLIATGGYGDRTDWLKEHFPNGEYINPVSPGGQDGDGQEMAWKHGAAKDGMGVAQIFMLVPDEPMDSALMQAGLQPNLWINKKGIRYCNEEIVYDFPMCVNALCEQPEATAYNIMDIEMMMELEEQGIKYTLGEYFIPGSKLTGLAQVLKNGIRSGKVIAASTLEELAEKMNIDPGQLQKTVEEYNACCEKNWDFVFGKKRMYLHSIKNPPYFSVIIKPVLGITEGGIKINENMEVLTELQDVIPGLYAGGCAAGGVVGNSYITVTSGGSLSFAVNSGRIAGESMLQYLETSC